MAYILLRSFWFIRAIGLLVFGCSYMTIVGYIWTIPHPPPLPKKYIFYDVCGIHNKIKHTT